MGIPLKIRSESATPLNASLGCPANAGSDQKSFGIIRGKACRSLTSGRQPSECATIVAQA